MWRESRIVVNLARPWVMAVAKTMCHVVRNSAVVGRVSYRYLEKDAAEIERPFGDLGEMKRKRKSWFETLTEV